jgi:hypothetical protein
MILIERFCNEIPRKDPADSGRFPTLNFVAGPSLWLSHDFPSADHAMCQINVGSARMQ